MKNYLQTFFVCSDGAVSDGETHATISDGIESLVAKGSGLGRHIRVLGERGCCVPAVVISIDRFAENRAPTCCLSFDRIGARQPSTAVLDQMAYRARAVR